MSRQVTIVMYHYVRDLERSRHPRIKGLDVAGFRRQLDHLESEFDIVTMQDVMAAARGHEISPKAALLTFDDGYADHYDTVFPILYDRGIQGSFFPPVAPVRDHQLLDVNRVHFVLASTDSVAELGAAVDAEVEVLAAEHGLGTVADYRAEWAHPNRFDDAETIYVKRMLQTALPPELRERIARKLFAKFVTADEEAFAAELYMTLEQAKVMVSSGMWIGSHGRSHRWLNRVDRSTQIDEVVGSVDFLRQTGMAVEDGWAMCYPYGGWNEGLLEVLREYDCTVGVTTEVATADLAEHDPLTLPRYDTNDFPQ